MPRQLSVEAICRLIDALLLKGYPVIEEVAGLLCTSPRSLQRWLNTEGVSYSELVEHSRCQVACESLEFTRDSVHDIGATLGYRGASSFTRAFRRWTGKTPRTYRNQSLGWQESRSNKANGNINVIR